MNATVTVVEEEAAAIASGQDAVDLPDQPAFEPSYWGFEYALPLYPGDKRSTMISGSLTTVAGLCGDHDVYLLDENVEDIDWESLRRYDIVGVTGMNVQKKRIREILLKLRERDIFTVVGGPFVSVQEEFFDGLCDVKFVGEAETTWPQFLDDYSRGKPTEQRSLRADRADRHDPVAPAAVRSAQGRSLCVRGAAVLARLPVSVRVLRHHRDLRPPAARSRIPTNWWPNWTTCAGRASTPPSSSTTTSSGTKEGQGAAGEDHSLDGRAPLSAAPDDRGQHRPGRRSRAAGPDVPGQLPQRVHRDRDARARTR